MHRWTERSIVLTTVTVRQLELALPQIAHFRFRDGPDGDTSVSSASDKIHKYIT